MPSNLRTEENLANVLERARTAGFLGPGPLRAHSEHALSFGHPIPSNATTLLDLGSGGGVPGLPLFARHPHLGGVLLDASEKRCAFLTWAVAELNLSDRVEVRRGRAEELAHEDTLRSGFDVVTCRGFGPPAATIEGAIGFLADGGVLVISEPPEGRSWSPTTLSAVGLVQLSASSYLADDVLYDSGADEPANGLPGEIIADLGSDNSTRSPRMASSDILDERSDGAWSNSQKEPVSPDETTTPALVVAFQRRGELPNDLPRALRKQRSRPLKVLVADE